MIAGILWIIGWLYVAGTGLAILLVLFAVTKDVKPSSGGFSIVPIMLTPLIFAASALCWFAFAELILLGLSMEARLHEISRRIRPRS